MDVKVLKTVFQNGCLIVGMLLFSLQASAAKQPFMEFSGGKVWVRDLDPEILYTYSRYFNSTDDWKSVFPVTTALSKTIPIDGSYEVFKTSVSFLPRFPFAAGVEYHASFNQEALAKNPNEVYLPVVPTEQLHFVFKPDSQTSTPPVITAIYPRANELPENLLKFHIAFSRSMTRGEIYQRVRLYNSRNETVDRPFLILDEELWDEEMKSVTLMLDPGRIKRGLRKNIEMGAPLREGERYTLEVQGGWPDRYGVPTAETVRKTFVCLAADRIKPNPRLWTITNPAAADPILTMHFHEPMDANMLYSSFRIRDEQGNLVPGETRMLDDQTGFTFKASTWSRQTYTVEINPRLEDLAGNNLTRLFDEDTSAGSPATAPTVLTFNFSETQD
jgi:hypothetical protein